MKVYCLSGLGVDHRAFRNFSVEGYELVHIPWIAPLKNESLPEYAKRLFELTDIPESYHLVGVSFGGMIAQEFEKIREPESLFLISTISDRSELSGIFKLGGKLKLYKLVPRIFIVRANFLTYFLFGVKAKEDKQLLKEILRDSEISFFRWAMGAIVQWKNKNNSSGIRIHGTKDKILPIKSNSDFSIQNAGHFMIVTDGKELSKVYESIPKNEKRPSR